MVDTTGQSADSSVQELDRILAKFRSAKQRLEPDWYLNVAFFNGDQWVMWNHGRIDTPKLAPWRVTLVDNRIMPVAFSRIARKLKNKPAFVVTPNSYNEDDINAASLGEKVLEDDWINLNLSIKLFNAMQWAEVCCAGFWKIYWDSTKGENQTEYVIDPSTGQAYQGPDGRPVLADSEGGAAVLGIEGFTSKPIAMGDIAIDTPSPFSIFPDPLAQELEDCEVIIEEHIRSVEYVKKHYGEDVEPDTDVPVGIAESRAFPFINDAKDSTEYKGVTIRELWAKGGSEYGPTGKRCVWVKNKTLLEEGLDRSPYEGCPYVMFPGIKVPGRFWPTCVTSQLRGPQTELNKLQSQIRENAVRLGNPAIAISRGANVDYTGVPGEKVYYDSNVPDAIPSYLSAPELPGYVQNEVDRIENSITEISGLHEVSKASVPSGVTAASAINLLQEADETRIGPEIQDMEHSLGEAGTKILKLRAKYQSDERLLRSAGEDGDWDIAAYRGSMSKENTNVEVQAGSAMPKSKAAKQASMTELFQSLLQYGVEFKPRDMRKFLREYGVGGLDSMFAGLSADEMQIKREHNIMKAGTPLDINDYDDDDLHIEAHEEFQKTKWYYNHPEVHQIVTMHVMGHKERRTQMIDAQVAEQQAAMNGASGATAEQPTQ